MKLKDSPGSAADREGVCRVWFGPALQGRTGSRVRHRLGVVLEDDDVGDRDQPGRQELDQRPAQVEGHQLAPSARRTASIAATTARAVASSRPARRAGDRRRRPAPSTPARMQAAAGAPGRPARPACAPAPLSSSPRSGVSRSMRDRWRPAHRTASRSSARSTAPRLPSSRRDASSTCRVAISSPQWRASNAADSATDLISAPVSSRCWASQGWSSPQVTGSPAGGA